MTKLLTVLLLAFSFAGCDLYAVKRPSFPVCVNNVPALHRRCYDFKYDFDDLGQISPNAKPKIVQYKTRDEMLDAINKSVSVDPDPLAILKAYLKDVRDAAGRKGD